MSRPDKATEDRIEDALNELTNWKKEDDTLKRELVAADFASAVGLINSIAIHAESMDHHPTITLYGWNKVRVELSTHDVGGLTELDFQLAEKIESISLNSNKGN